MRDWKVDPEARKRERRLGTDARGFWEERDWRRASAWGASGAGGRSRLRERESILKRKVPCGLSERFFCAR